MVKSDKNTTLNGWYKIKKIDSAEDNFKIYCVCEQDQTGDGLDDIWHPWSAIGENKALIHSKEELIELRDLLDEVIRESDYEL